MFQLLGLPVPWLQPEGEFHRTMESGQVSWLFFGWLVGCWLVGRLVGWCHSSGVLVPSALNAAVGRPPTTRWRADGLVGSWLSVY